MYQMAEDRKKMNVLGHFSGGLTKSQGAWAVITLECNAQVRTRLMARALLGANPCICWTDHSNVVRLQTAIDLDPRHLRWIANLMSDGSVLMNLSGRSAKLGDGLSRNPITDQFREQAKAIQGFSVKEFLEDCASGGMEPQTLPSHCLPDTEVESYAAVYAAAGERMDVQVLLMEDYGSSTRREMQQAQVWRDLTAAYPWVNFKFDVCEPSFRDDMHQGFWFDPEPQRTPNLEHRVRRLRRDCLTGIAKAIRELARVKPQLVLGIGQGGVMALLLSRPRICETALRNKVVQATEMKATGMSEAWQGVQAILVGVPQIFKARTSLKMLTDAMPELLKAEGPHPERAIECFSLGWTYSHVEFEKEVMVLLNGVIVKGAEQILLDALIRRRPLQLNHHYVCPCGKTTLLLPMCPACTALDQAEEAADRLPQEPQSDEAEGDQVASLADGRGPVLHFKREGFGGLVSSWWSRTTAEHWLGKGRGCLVEATGVAPGRMTFPTIPTMTRYRLMYAYGPDGLQVVQKCVDPVFETDHDAGHPGAQYSNHVARPGQPAVDAHRLDQNGGRAVTGTAIPRLHAPAQADPGRGEDRDRMGIGGVSHCGLPARHVRGPRNVLRALRPPVCPPPFASAFCLVQVR